MNIDGGPDDLYRKLAILAVAAKYNLFA